MPFVNFKLPQAAMSRTYARADDVFVIPEPYRATD